MCCEWSPSADSGQTRGTPPPPPSPIDILPTPVCNIYFRCDFFSPLVPFLCLTCLPSLNQYGWLDNFTGSLTPKATPERESPTPWLLDSSCASPLWGRLSKLWSLRCFSRLWLHGCSLTACCTGGHTLMHGTYPWISHFLPLCSFIGFSLSDCATPLLSDCLSVSPSASVSLSFPSLSLPHKHTHIV